MQSEYYFRVFAAFVTLRKLCYAYITMYIGQIECFSRNTDKQDDTVDIRQAEDTGGDDGGGHSHS